MKPKVIFFIVPNCSDDQWLNQKMMQITESFVAVLNSHDDYPVKTINNYSELNNYLDQADLLFVLNAGNVICNPSKILKKLKSIPESIGLMGHILKTTEEETPYLHNQMFIVRTSAFKNLQFESVDDVGLEIVRSVEDLHDGRAPLFVTLGTNEVERRPKFGTKLILDCLTNGYEVRNFDNEWRWNIDEKENFVNLDKVNEQTTEQLKYFPSKGYCYPEKNSKTFSQALRHLKIIPGLDNAQEIFIATFRQALDFKILNAFTYDISVEVPFKDVAICPATGFFGEVTAIKSNASTLVLYDKNPNNIEFKKDLYQYWNGENYHDFVFNWNKSKNLKIEPLFDVNNAKKDIAYKEAMELLLPVWKSWKESINIKFKHCDLILDIDELLQEDTGNSLIYTSTILGDYPITHVVYDKYQIEAVKEKIAKQGIYWLQ